jgi:hypothetical protein
LLNICERQAAKAVSILILKVVYRTVVGNTSNRAQQL